MISVTHRTQILLFIFLVILYTGSIGVSFFYPQSIFATSHTITVDYLSISNDRSPELTGTISDPVATIDITIDGNTYSATNNGDGTWTLPADTINPPLSRAGSFDVVATATDALLTTATDSSNPDLVLNDTENPIGSIGPFITTDPSPALGGPASDNFGLAFVAVTIDGTQYFAPDLVFDGTTWSLAQGIISPPLINGTSYAIDLFLADLYGNNQTYTFTNAVTFDTAYGSSQCYDGIDNDGDLLVDFPDDPDCASTHDNDEFDNAQGQSPPDSSSGQRRRLPRSTVQALQQVPVFPETKQCTAFTQYLRLGDRNGLPTQYNPSVIAHEVDDIQQFLNAELAGLATPLVVDGIFGPETMQAVKTYQKKYHDIIIAPWKERIDGYQTTGQGNATGNWYKISRYLANNIVRCPEDPLFLEQVAGTGTTFQYETLIESGNDFIFS